MQVPELFIFINDQSKAFSNATSAKYLANFFLAQKTHLEGRRQTAFVPHNCGCLVQTPRESFISIRWQIIPGYIVLLLLLIALTQLYPR